jgi:AcrR family transcriptional regulator
MSITAPAGNLRETILESARKLFAAEGYQSVSMRRIGHEAGCSPMAVYRHFASKQELLLSICEESFAHMMRNLERPHPDLPLVEQLRARMATFIRFCAAHPSHYRLAFLDAAFAGVDIPSRRSLREHFRTLVAECIAKSGVAENAALNSDAYFMTLLACMHGAILLLISGQKLAVPREVFLAELIATATEVFNPCP